MKKRVTMEDIAQKLGISKNSVSRALSGKSGVSEKTRKLVVKTAKELGYVYSKKNKHVDKQKKYTFGLIATDFAFGKRSFFGQIFLAIEQKVQETGHDLLIQSISKTAQKKLELPDFIQEKKVDGIIIVSHITTAYIQRVLDTNIPTILIDHHEPHLNVDAILTNNRFGAYQAVKHLIDLGHRDIAYVGNIDFSPSYYERLEGYFLALKEANIQPKKEYLFTDAEEKLPVIKDFIHSLTEMPSAWFCVNDGLGFLVSTALQGAGFNIPEDVSVCSFDNGELSQIYEPAITTMDIDLTLYGRQAVEKLIWRIENPDEPFHETLYPAKLIIRESTGPLKGKQSLLQISTRRSEAALHHLG